MKKKVENAAQPVIRLRSMFIGLCTLVVCIAGPLALVWKQSYINQASLRLESRADTLAALNREITTLKLECGRLTSAPRIERIAKSRGLEYPASRQIEVLAVRASKQKNEAGLAGIWARIRQSLLGESG